MDSNIDGRRFGSSTVRPATRVGVTCALGFLLLTTSFAAARTPTENEASISAAQPDARKEDAAIERHVKKGLKTNAGLKGVGVSVREGVIHLTGSVPSGWMHFRASIIAHAAEGNRAVDDRIRVTPRD